MISTLLFIGVALILLFGFVVLFGAPYLPTTKRQITTALDMLDLKPGQTMLELGCGDGRVIRAAAQRGWNVVGYEINPLLVLLARAHTWKYRKLVQIRWKNFWHANWPEAEGIYVFLLDKYMKRLDKKITQKYKGKKVKLASFAFQIPDKKAQNKFKGLFLYQYH
ncbi:MAG: class I SAM-dependent methyltransferase [Candidatus Saccharibacteria bacterium]|nr:class I SAM-dependent methyltransferase [Candidatus Saccharibacteria bacterium]